MTRRRTQGSTLLELLVTLAIMAIVASVVTLALRSDARQAPDGPSLMEAARRSALASRRPVTVQLEVAGRTVMVTMLPDGGAVADSALRIDRLTGASGRAHARP